MKTPEDEFVAVTVGVDVSVGVEVGPTTLSMSMVASGQAGFCFENQPLLSFA